jgi:hypothetical protein
MIQICTLFTRHNDFKSIVKFVKFAEFRQDSSINILNFANFNKNKVINEVTDSQKVLYYPQMQANYSPQKPGVIQTAQDII